MSPCHWWMRASAHLSVTLAAWIAFGASVSAQATPPCQAGQEQSCVEQATALVRGAATAPAGRAQLEALCTGGVQEACGMLGGVLVDGVGGPADVPRGVSLWTQLCDSGNGHGCYSLGVHAEGTGDGGLVASIPHFRRSCDAGYARGCAAAADNILSTGDVASVRAEAATLYERACRQDGTLAACALAQLHRRATQPRPDPVTVSVTLAEQCEDGDLESCDSLATRFLTGSGERRSLARGVALLRRACGGGVARACYRLGAMFLVGEGVTENRAHAIALFRRACDQGHAEACDDLGGQSEGAEKHALTERACTLGSARACYGLGVEQVDAEQLARATPYFERACQLGLRQGCFDLAVSLHRGEGVPVDRQRALRVIENACVMGDEDSCN